MNYKKINFYLGWMVFLAATIVYFITLEDTVSLWDCGEYITAANKLEVGHPPGAPFFMVIGRLFSFFADPENVAIWINRLSAISSSLTILFMFWSLTMLIKKMVLKRTSEISKGDKIAIFGGALIGSLAYTFTESFWFSAVEGEVYAMASLFTAAIFWAILKWDEEMMEIQSGALVAKGFSPDRWLLLIMFLLGLAIGVHLLGILVVPAIAFVIYFRYSKKVDFKGILLVGILSVFILGFIQEAVIPGSISMASSFEIAFVNSMGLPFYTGSIFFFVLLIGALIFGMRWARKTGRRVVYSSFMGLALLLIGYGSFAVIVIRSNANPPLDENDPENLVTLHSYLKREQYGSAPLLFGQYWNSEMNDREFWDDNSPYYLRRYTVTKGDNDIKAFKDEKRANEYAKNIPGSEVVEKYFQTKTGEKEVPTYSQTTFFPRMYWSSEPHKVAKYKEWSGYDSSEDVDTETGADDQRLPTFGENITYFWNYQVNFMYWRYFLWNFAGRQNDIQGHGGTMRGNWKSGFSMIDHARLGSQAEAPFYTQENKSNNSFYFLPLILGLIGMIFHFYRAPKDAFVVLLAFLFTGLAIVVYLNQKPMEPRERDYAYAGSFYFFAMWIGIGVYALYEAFRGFSKTILMRIGMILAAGLGAFLIADAWAGDGGMVRTMTWVIVAGIGAAAIGLMVVLGKYIKGDEKGSVIAVLMGLAIPVIMGVQGWDDHDRSLKSSARDLAMNYLNSCSKNGILFTNGDNDTFPLWYMQEVEGKRTDVRVCNLSLMQTDWYTEQMKLRAYDSDPLPIKFTEDQTLMYIGNTDQVFFMNVFELLQEGAGANQEAIKSIIKLRLEGNDKKADDAVNVLSQKSQQLLKNISSTKNRGQYEQLRKAKNSLAKTSTTEDKVNFMYSKFKAGMYVLKSLVSGQVGGDQSTYENFLQVLMDFEAAWNFTDLDKAMEFVRDDDNLLLVQGQNEIRTFPSSGFTIKVNAENALKSGIITKDQKDQCHEAMTFQFQARYLTKEQVMMLDIIGNNDWKRGLYFSSPGGSEVAKALYRAGYIKQNGMAFEFSPLNIPSMFNEDRMYKNLMEVYSYGPLNNPDVLTDYYTRRHTGQYRSHFLMLAENYMRRALQVEEQREMMSQQVGPNGEENPGLAGLPNDKEVKKWKDRAHKLIKKSLEVMPADVVIDYGEPAGGRDSEAYEINGRKLTNFSDGVLHDYVSILYLAGDKKAAEELGETVATQLESIINYFVASDTKIMTDKDNTKDLYAALDAYYTLWISARDKEAGNPTGKLAKRVNKNLNNYYNTSFKSIIDRMKDRANEQGEGTRRSSNAGPMATALFEFQDYIDAMAYTYGLKKPPMAPTDVNQGNPNANPNQPTPRNPGPQMEGGQQQVPVMPVPVGGQ